MRGIYFSLMKSNLMVADGKDSSPRIPQPQNKHLCSDDFSYAWKMLLNRLQNFSFTYQEYSYQTKLDIFQKKKRKRKRYGSVLNILSEINISVYWECYWTPLSSNKANFSGFGIDLTSDLIIDQAKRSQTVHTTCSVQGA